MAQDRERPPEQYRTRWILLLALVVLAIGVAILYTLYYEGWFDHAAGSWRYAADLWLTVRSAQWVTWGGISYLYSSGSLLVTLPGFAVLFAPIVALAAALHLSESAPGIYIPRPSSLFLFLPYCIALSSSALFALDHLAFALGARGGRRLVLNLLVLLGVFATVVLWGHPEDVLALAFLAWALVAYQGDHPVATGWLIGVAIAMQLYVVLPVPLFVGLYGRRRAPQFLVRAALLPLVLLLTELLPNLHNSLRALFNQPNFPHIDHGTPWAYLAPHLSGGAIAAGPSRLVSLGVACLVGTLAVRRRRRLLALTWLVALALSLRCVFESVVDPYYVLPIAAFAVVAGSQQRALRFSLCCAAAVGLSLMTYLHEGYWSYWLEMCALVAATLGLAWPGRVPRAGAATTAGRRPAVDQAATSVATISS